jgi:putative DNA primase/helicase
MADLRSILGGSWSPPKDRAPEPPEQQLRDAMASAGITPPAAIHLDGALHRFVTGAKGRPGAGDKSGWYIAFGDGIPAGRFGCWRAGIEHSWRADVGRTVTAVEEMAHARRMAEAIAARDAERQRTRETAADTVAAIWEGCGPAAPAHPYLARKGIQAHGARVTGDGRLVVPLYQPDGDLVSLQYIAADGQKLYHPGGQAGGSCWWIGDLEADSGPIYLAEGFATAATIYEVADRPVVVAYSASNLVPVAGSLRARFPAREMVIVADHDASGVGQRYAEQAAAKHGARVVVPPTPGDANDYRAAGHDLAALLNPPADGWLIPADEFSAQPSPIRWLVRGWLQAESLLMVHGPSGGGKTFVVLDWSLTLAAGREMWRQARVKPGPVVYLAGEGHAGLRARIAAWKQHHGVERLDMWLSRDGLDLNTPDGYRRTAEAIRALDRRPVLIVVDTLHRFLAGDENSAQDAKSMLDACARLMTEFGCSVLLVHHTGVMEEAQHRARGSSAWRGALDIEISVVAAKGQDPIQIVQRKSKDAELTAPAYARLEQVPIAGWTDEDGQPVGSAVAVEADAPVERPKIDHALAGHRQMFKDIWLKRGAEDRDGLPYLSRAALVDYLIEERELEQSSADQVAKGSVPGKMTTVLAEAGVITIEKDGKKKTTGYLVIDPAQAAAMMIARKEDQEGRP